MGGRGARAERHSLTNQPDPPMAKDISVTSPGEAGQGWGVVQDPQITKTDQMAEMAKGDVGRSLADRGQGQTTRDANDGINSRGAWHQPLIVLS